MDAAIGWTPGEAGVTKLPSTSKEKIHAHE
jgi:hypothetical protein